MTSDQMRAEVQRLSQPPELSPEEMDYIDALPERLKTTAVFELQMQKMERMTNFICYLRGRNGA